MYEEVDEYNSVHAWHTAGFLVYGTIVCLSSNRSFEPNGGWTNKMKRPFLIAASGRSGVPVAVFFRLSIS